MLSLLRKEDSFLLQIRTKTKIIICPSLELIGFSGYRLQLPLFEMKLQFIKSVTVRNYAVYSLHYYLIISCWVSKGLVILYPHYKTNWGTHISASFSIYFTTFPSFSLGHIISHSHFYHSLDLSLSTVNAFSIPIHNEENDRKPSSLLLGSLESSSSPVQRNFTLSCIVAGIDFYNFTCSLRDRTRVSDCRLQGLMFEQLLAVV